MGGAKESERTLDQGFDTRSPDHFPDSGPPKGGRALLKEDVISRGKLLRMEG
jgi:hypothetical protein